MGDMGTTVGAGTTGRAGGNGNGNGDGDGDLRASDGRVPGRRGLLTRTRLLEHTRDLIGTTSYRDLKVVDIARAAGMSPATFYQYFPDAESALLALADELVGEGRERLTRDLREGPGRARRRTTPVSACRRASCRSGPTTDRCWP